MPMKFVPFNHKKTLIQFMKCYDALSRFFVLQKKKFTARAKNSWDWEILIGG